MRREQFVNDSSTTTNEALDSSETVVTVTDGSVFPSDGDFRVIVESEVMLCISRSGNDLTVVRGVDGTTAVSHTSGVTIKALLTANNLIDFVDQASGIGASVRSGGSHRFPHRVLDINNNTLDSSDFTWGNQGSSTVSDDPGGTLTLKVVESAASGWKILYKSAPTPPYKLTVNLMFGPGFNYGATNGSHIGVGFRQSSTGKLMVGQCRMGVFYRFARLTNETTFSAFATTENIIECEWDEVWLEIEDDNTNLIFRVSNDGLNYFTMGSDGRTAFMTGGPDQIFWGGRDDGAANRLVHLRAWIEE